MTLQHEKQPILETASGRLVGAMAPNGVCSFKGIPYALPPIGDRRWKPAEPTPAWMGTRLATEYGPDSVQLPMPDNTFFSWPNRLQSEDCLYLNVWTSVQQGRKQPVMVWIHGGGLTSGSGAMPIYDGAQLARKGVVVVTINYRLGVFGYFAHPELSAESPNGAAGNYGTTDQIQALKWIQENIEAFGGDPDNVTIFGQSAGSWSVSHLLASPLSKGLFHKAIGQSGAYWYSMRHLREMRYGRSSAEEQGRQFAAAIGNHSLADLRRLSAVELQNAAFGAGIVIPGEFAIIDGWVFPESVYDIFAQGKQHNVPVLVGFNADEASGLADFGVVAVPESDGAYVEEVRNRFGDLAEDYLSVYPPDNVQDAVFDAWRDGFGTWSMESWARMTANVSSNAYLYLFSHTPPGATRSRPIPPGSTDRRIGAYHGAEIAYVFNNLDPASRLGSDCPADPPQSADWNTAEVMSDYWVAFARTGIPDVEGLPKWQPYTANNQDFMEFNQGAKPGQDCLPGAWEIQEKIHSRRQALNLFWNDAEYGLSATLK